MIRIHLKRCFVTLVVLGVCSQAHAAGFGFNERSALATGRLQAVTARLEAPSTLFYNPAGLTQLKGFQLTLGAQLVTGTNQYEDPAGNLPDAEAKLLKPIPNFGMSYELTDWLVMGTGLYVPHGLAVEWPDDFAGRAIAQFAELKAPHATLGAAFKVMDELSVGISGYFAFTQLALERDLFGNTVKIESHPLFQNKGDGLGWGGSVGMQYRPIEGFHMGAYYKTKTDLTYEDGRFFLYDSADVKKAEAITKTTLTLPSDLALGVGYEISDELYVEANATLTTWSVIDELALYFSELGEECGEGCSPSPLNNELIEELKWQDAWFLRVGADWQVSDSVLLSTGIGFDMSPIPDETLSPLLPGSDRVPVSLGISYKIPSMPLYIDASYLLVYFLPRTVEGEDARFPATYSTIANLFGLNLRYVSGE